MNLSEAFKSIVDLDDEPIVITDMDHKIVYLNPTAQKRYKKYGGASLIGQSLLDCHNAHSIQIIKDTLSWFAESVDNNKKYTHRRHNCDVYIVALRDGAGRLIGYYEKHESRVAEKERK